MSPSRRITDRDVLVVKPYNAQLYERSGMSLEHGGGARYGSEFSFCAIALARLGQPAPILLVVKEVNLVDNCEVRDLARHMTAAYGS